MPLIAQPNFMDYSRFFRPCPMSPMELSAAVRWECIFLASSCSAQVREPEAVGAQIIPLNSHPPQSTSIQTILTAVLETLMNHVW
jgi:hypothetical protein